MPLARPRPAMSPHAPGALADRDRDRGSAATLPAQGLIGVPALQRCSAGSLPRRSLKVKARRRVHVLPLAKYRATGFCDPFARCRLRVTASDLARAPRPEGYDGLDSSVVDDARRHEK